MTAARNRLELLILPLLALLFLLASLPYYDRTLNTFDEGVINCPAERIAAGEVPYRDFFLKVNPGTFYATAWLFRSFGVSLLAGRLAAVVVGVLTMLGIYALGRWTSDSRTYAAAGAIGFACWSTNQFPILWYTAFAWLFVIAALATAHFGFRDRRWLFVAGACCALAWLAKQNLGPPVAVGIGITLLLRNRVERAPWRRLITEASLLVAGLAAVAGAALVMLAAAGALSPWYSQTVTFAREHFLARRFALDPFGVATLPAILFAFAGTLAALWSLNNPQLLARGGPRRKLVVASAFVLVTLANVFLISNIERAAQPPGRYFSGGPYEVLMAAGVEFVARSLPVAIAVAAFIVVAKDLRKSRLDPTFTATALTAPLATYVAVIAGADVTHMVLAITPMWALVARIARAGVELARWAGTRLGSTPRLPETRFCGVLLGLLLTLGCFLGQLSAWDQYVNIYARVRPIPENTYSLLAPRAAGISTDPTTGSAVDAVAMYLAEHTEVGEPVFVFPNDPILYVLAGRPNPTFYNHFLPETFIPGDSARVIGELEAARVRYVVRRLADDEEDQFDMYHAIEPTALPIAEHLVRRYVAVARFGEYEVMARKPDGGSVAAS